MRKRRLTRKERRSKQKKVVIMSVLCLLFVMTAGYAAFQTNLSITAKGNIKEQSKVIQSWSNTSNEDFHTDYYKENIVSVTFLDNNKVPDNATESWDVSEEGKGGVMAYVVPNNEDNAKYDLYIGAKNGVIANENSGYLFYQFTGTKEINFNNNFDTENVIYMNHMFGECLNLLKLDLNFFNTSNVIDMNNMFCDCRVIESIDLTSFNTSNVTNMFGMFGRCYKLTSIDVSKFNTSNVTVMTSMFQECTSLSEIDVSNFDTSRVTDMRSMFSNCESLSSLDVSNFDTSNVIKMDFMFCKINLTTLNLCSFDTSNVINMNSMFGANPKLEVVYVGDNWTTENADTTNIFAGSGVSEVTTGQC